jgi:adenylate kinase
MAQDRLPSLLLFGGPGVGKGTQGQALGTLPGFFHFSSGAMFRELDMQSPLGRQVHKFADRGELVPDELTIDVWRNSLDKLSAAGEFDRNNDLLILDGIPRNVRQSTLLDGHIEVLRVIHLEASDPEAMVQRIKGRAVKENRADDADESVIRRRLKVYREESAPVLDYYPRAIVCTVDALGTPAEVLRGVLDCVIPVQKEFRERA